MILVAIAMISMLAMAALAIDVITLYAARSEAQRAADSAALAAAKMLVDAGVTGDPTLTNPTVQSTAQTLATQVAQSVAGQSAIAGRTIATTDVSVSFPTSGTPAAFAINPTVSVTVQNTNLPAFFSRIWSRAALTVRATATAEGFNPSNSSSIAAGGVGIPTIARSVKPFLLPNCDPVNANNPGSPCGAGNPTFFNAATGALTNPGLAPAGIIGETFNVSSACLGSGPGCTPGTATAGLYYPVALPAATDACPSTCGGVGTNFETDIECSNPSPISCGTTATAPIVDSLLLDGTVFPEGGGGPAQSGVECLIHQRPGNGMDTLITPITYPLQMQVGHNHPLQGTPTLSTGDYITTSDSLVTVPVYDPTTTPNPTTTTAVNIIGFLQVFIIRVWPAGGGPKAGSFDVTIVNVSGCGSGATGTPVYTGSSNAVPVRLIHQ